MPSIVFSWETPTIPPYFSPLYFKANVILCAWRKTGWQLFFACWPHCQSVVADRIQQHQNYSFLRYSFACKLLVSSRSGRTGEGHLRVCWLLYQSANPLSFCHHNSNVLAELPIKRSWLCTFIISWQPLPQSITTQLNSSLKQFEGL